jgi:heme exporter protein C
MKKAFAPLLVVVGMMFVVAPFLIANAPYESTMGLIQKIFYYHVPSWFAMYVAIGVCGVASAVYLFKGTPIADAYATAGAEVAVVFGLCGLITGPLWGRVAWGVWWQWDVRLTTALLLELIFIAYLMVRQFGGPGAEKLAAATAIFGTATAPFVYKSVDIWRTVHPNTNVIPTLKPSMGGPFAFSSLAFILLSTLLLTARVHLAKRQMLLDQLYLAHEEES